MKIPQLAIKLTSTLIIISVLVSCGFHLKGDRQHLSSALNALAIQAQEGTGGMQKVIAQKALLNRITIDQHADWILILTKFSQQSIRVTSTQSVSRDQFRIKLILHYQIRHKNNTFITQNLTRQRLFNDDKDQPLSKQREQSTIIKELMNEMSAILIQQLETLSINPPECDCDEDSTRTTQ